MPWDPWCSAPRKFTSPRAATRWSTTSDLQFLVAKERSANVASTAPETRFKTGNGKTQMKTFQKKTDLSTRKGFVPWFSLMILKHMNVHSLYIKKQFCTKTHYCKFIISTKKITEKLLEQSYDNTLLQLRPQLMDFDDVFEFSLFELKE
jgi:hypothetical protein